MKQRRILLLGIVITLAIAGGVGSLMRLMAPVGAGNPEDFWYVACGVKLAAEQSDYFTSGRTALRDGCFIYEMGHLHGSTLFRIRRSEAMAEFTKVVDKLESKVPKRDPNSWFIAGYLKWKEQTEATADDANALLNNIAEARDARHRARSPEGYAYQKLDDYFFERRLRQAKRYWANLVFEFLFLSGLVWLALWPMLRGKQPWRWALHLGLVPLLFIAPVYLGYATYTFTSRGPSGGVLYPWLVLPFAGGSMNHVDRFILERIPQILEPLSQGIGSWIALTGMGFRGPTKVAGLSAVVSVCALVLAYALRKRRRANPA
ncbi:MAG: hypothetical protein ACYTEL_09075 [Planctomycetota bacterium]